MKEKRKRGGEEGVHMCLAMAFSRGVPVVVGWEFPSVRAGRKTTEDVFFLAHQECPGLEVFPLLVCVLHKFIPECLMIHSAPSA